MTSSDPDAARYRGIGRLSAALGCTAFLLPTSTDPAARAFVATSGHCAVNFASRPETTRISRDLPPDRGAKIRFGLFADATAPLAEVAVHQYRYATMRGHDLAILELDTTLGALAAQGITPLPLAAALPAEGSPATVVGHPRSLSMRRAECNWGTSKTLVESYWRWPYQLSNNCSDIYSGSSGSPAFNASGEVVGVLGTTTQESVTTTCYTGSPCELTPTGTTTAANTNYTTTIQGLTHCFTAGAFTPDAASCPLTPVGGVVLESSAFSPTQPTRITNTPGVLEPRKWAIVFASDSTAFVRYALGPSHSTDCGNLSNYGPPVAAAVALSELSVRDLPTADGAYSLCLLGGPDATFDARWQQPQHATPLTIYIDTTPPTLEPLWSFGVGTDPTMGLFSPLARLPENAGFRYLVVAAGASCNAPGYQSFIRVPFRVAKPARVCLIPQDLAGNMSAPFAIDLQ